MARPDIPAEEGSVPQKAKSGVVTFRVQDVRDNDIRDNDIRDNLNIPWGHAFRQKNLGGATAGPCVKEVDPLTDSRRPVFRKR